MKKILFLLLALILAACAASQPDDKVLFSDGFSDTQSGWKIWADEKSSLVAYDAETLRFLVNAPNQDLWSHPGKNYENALLFVTAQAAGGPQDNHYGLICRYADEDNYYAFLISSDGYAGIIKVKDGQTQMLSAATMEYQPVIRRGNVENELAAGCVGNDLALIINGETVYQVQDVDFTEGDIGLLVGSHAAGGVDVRFDNLVVLEP